MGERCKGAPCVCTSDTGFGAGPDTNAAEGGGDCPRLDEEKTLCDENEVSEVVDCNAEKSLSVFEPCRACLCFSCNKVCLTPCKCEIPSVIGTVGGEGSKGLKTTAKSDYFV